MCYLHYITHIPIALLTEGGVIIDFTNVSIIGYNRKYRSTLYEEIINIWFMADHMVFREHSSALYLGMAWKKGNPYISIVSRRRLCSLKTNCQENYYWVWLGRQDRNMCKSTDFIDHLQVLLNVSYEF